MIKAPFTDDQVSSLNGFQLTGVFHEFTCDTPGCTNRTLEATNDGWICEGCSYTQDWAHEWMADWTWRLHPIAMMEEEK